MEHYDTIDSAKLDALVARAVGDLSAGYGGVMISLGNRLGLYKAMAEAGRLNAREIATRTDCAERYVREWLNSQVAGGYLTYHPVNDVYELTPEQALVLANEDSPVFFPSAWAVPASMWADEEKAVEAFRTGAGIPWGDHDGRSLAGSQPSIATSTRQAWSPNGCRRSTGWWTSSSRALAWPTLAAAMVIRRC
jgi:hypothetical protein